MLNSECWTYSEAACPSTCEVVYVRCLPRDWQDVTSTVNSYVVSKLVMLSDYTECKGLDEDDCDDKYLQCSYQQCANGTFYEDASCQVQVFTGATSLITEQVFPKPALPVRGSDPCMIIKYAGSFYQG